MTETPRASPPAPHVQRVRRRAPDAERVRDRHPGGELDAQGEPGRDLRAEPVVGGQPVVPHLPGQLTAHGRRLGRLPRPGRADLPAYVTLQSDAETKLQGVLEAHADQGADAKLRPRSIALLGRLFTPSRYLCHGFQQVEAYIGFMAPSSYITSAASFSTADFLRRVTTIAYRTRELQIAWPGGGHRLDGTSGMGRRRRLAAGPQGDRVRPGQLRLGGGVHRAQPGARPDPR